MRYDYKYYSYCKRNESYEKEYDADHTGERKTYWRCRCAEQIVVFV